MKEIITVSQDLARSKLIDRHCLDAVIFFSNSRELE